jgi:hypothetical protein
MLAPLLLAALSLPVPAGDDPLAGLEVTWRGEERAALELPPELGPGPPAALAAWAGWAVEHGYRLTLSDDGRALLVTHERSRSPKKRLELLHRTEAAFDALLPAPERGAAPEPGAPAGAPDGPPPEDPGGPPPEDPGGGPGGLSPEGLEPLPYSWSHEWGVGTWPLDTETCVLFVCRTEEDHDDLVETLGEMQDYLAGWVETGKEQLGFVHQRPLVAAFVEGASGLEEWDPDNELVHRAAQLLFVRRFSAQQPYWLAQGLAWHLEHELRGTIYCFPYRSEFVWATEHTGWDRELQRRFKGRAKEPLHPDEFMEWRRGSYDADAARVTFGIAGFLARHHADRLPDFCEALRLYALEHGRRDLGGGSWERIPGYEVPAAEQLRLLRELFGETVLEELTASFEKGKRYRPGRR